MNAVEQAQAREEFAKGIIRALDGGVKVVNEIAQGTYVRKNDIHVWLESLKRRVEEDERKQDESI